MTLAQELHGRGNLANQQSTIRLCEIGPRMELEIVKEEEGLCSGAVLFHRYVEKTEQERKQTADRVAERARVKAERRRQQDENVRKKEQERRRKQDLKEMQDLAKVRFGRSLGPRLLRLPASACQAPWMDGWFACLPACHACLPRIYWSAV